MKISVCIPMYNENRIIADTARILSEYMAKHFTDYEIVFCSDGSTDGCDETVRALHLPNVQVISNTPNRGKGHAVRTAMLAATGDIRIFTDADLAYGVDVIGRIADKFAETPRIALVIGSRNLCRDGYRGYTWLRKVASKTYIRILSCIGGVRISDSQCGCKAFSAEAAQKIFSRCEIDGFSFDFETILWASKMNMEIREIPVCIINHGASKVHVLRDAFRMLRDLKTMRRRIKKVTL